MHYKCGFSPSDITLLSGFFGRYTMELPKGELISIFSYSYILFITFILIAIFLKKFKYTLFFRTVLGPQ